MTAGSLRPCFIDAANRRIFVQHRVPAAPTEHCVLIVPAFAEEMNKCRKMLTDVSRALLQHSIASVMPDLSGTGDSEQEFGTANWGLWREDLAATVDWCRSQGLSIRGAVGVRLGCALLADLAQDALPDLRCSVMWQPVANGKDFLTQFLRLRVAATMMDSARKETVDELLAKLRAGQSVEVAGYDLSPQLAADLQQIALDRFMTSKLGQLHVMEVVRNAATPPGKASERLLQGARAAGVSATPHRIEGEPYWASTEIVRIEALVARTVEVLAKPS